MTKARVNADNASADIQGVTASTGLTGGGTSGTVSLAVDTTVIQERVANVTDTEIGYLDGVSSAIQTQLNARITNALVDAKGDIIAATANDTPARLGVGANNTVLTADSAEATGLKWATPTSGSLTLLSTTTLTANTNITGINQTYQHLYCTIEDVTFGSAGGWFMVNPNTAQLYGYLIETAGTSPTNRLQTSTTGIFYPNVGCPTTGGKYFGSFLIENYAGTTNKKFCLAKQSYDSNSFGQIMAMQTMVLGAPGVSAAITQLSVSSQASATASGTLKIYGVK